MLSWMGVGEGGEGGRGGVGGGAGGLYSDIVDCFKLQLWDYNNPLNYIGDQYIGDQYYFSSLNGEMDASRLCMAGAEYVHEPIVRCNICSYCGKDNINGLWLSPSYIRRRSLEDEVCGADISRPGGMYSRH